MHITRIGALAGVAGALALAAACAIEPDPEAVENCKPGEYQCLSDDRLRQCTDDGLWGGAQPFVCAFSDCMIMDNVPVCM